MSDPEAASKVVLKSAPKSLRDTRRERAAFMRAVGAIGLAILGFVAFVVIYWSAGSAQFLGPPLFFAFAFLGWALVTSSHSFLEHQQVIEPREIRPSSQSENELVVNIHAGLDSQRRRALVRLAVVGAGAFAAAVLSGLRSLIDVRDTTLKYPIWQRGQRLLTIDGLPISLGSLFVGGTVSVFPESKVGAPDAEVVLVRVDERLLRLPKDRSDWAPQGYLAYSRVCTHAGCSVGLYQAETCLLQCPCHQSTFDVLSAAQPTGGPAARALPQLPLYADGDGYLCCAGDLSAPPGPGYWEL